MTVVTQVYSSPEFKIAACRAADQAGIPLSEWMVKVCAGDLPSLNRPELGKIPRKRSGAPRKELLLPTA